MSTEFKDQVKKEVEEEEQAEILRRCKFGVSYFKEKLESLQEDVKIALNNFNVFLGQVETDPKSAAKRFPGRDDD